MRRRIVRAGRVTTFIAMNIAFRSTTHNQNARETGKHRIRDSLDVHARHLIRDECEHSHAVIARPQVARELPDCELCPANRRELRTDNPDIHAALATLA